MRANISPKTVSLDEYDRPQRLLLHFSDTHLIAGNGLLYGTADADGHLKERLAAIEASGVRPDAMVFTGDLADKGDPDAYTKLRSMVEPLARRLDAKLVWLMGNHDDRGALRRDLLDQFDDGSPVDDVVDLGGLRLIILDTTVPGAHHGELDVKQLKWLKRILATRAPLGSILAMHHPPIPCVQERATVVELRGQKALAEVVRGSDIRTILGGHLHYSTSAMFANIPVSVAAATSYNQDLNVSVGGGRGHDGGQSFNLVHVFENTIVHSVSTVASEKTVGEIVSPGEAQQVLENYRRSQPM
jgi:Icc protein